MAAYVKYLEGVGARVVPLIMGEPFEETYSKLIRMNGILFPGGGGDYISFGRSMYEYILMQNDAGNVYPGIGICLGFESLATWASSVGGDVLVSLEAEDVALPIDFTVDPAGTKMFGPMGESAYLFENYAMAANYHYYSVKPDQFDTDEGLSSIFNVTSTSEAPGDEH